MIVVAGVAVILGLGVAYLRSRDTFLRVKVFNETSAPLDDLRFELDDIGAESKLFGSTTRWRAHATVEVLPPGGVTFLDIECPRDANVTFSCKTPDATVKTGLCRIHLGPRSPGYWDSYMEFHVEPFGVRTVAVSDALP
jgi:hypothetical protein